MRITNPLENAQLMGLRPVQLFLMSMIASAGWRIGELYIAGFFVNVFSKLKSIILALV